MIKPFARRITRKRKLRCVRNYSARRGLLPPPPFPPFAIHFWFVVSSQTKVDEKLDTRRAIVVVETILSHFSERRFLITDYYEHWKVHVVSGKEFKSQWQQFVQNARKVSC